MTSLKRRCRWPQFSGFFGLDDRSRPVPGSIASLAVVVLTLNACGPQDRDTKVHKLTLPTTEAACLSAGGVWNAPTPEKIVSGCSLKTTDGGRSCTTSIQCQSHCVEHEDGSRCAASVDGCFSETGRGTVRQCVN